LTVVDRCLAAPRRPGSDPPWLLVSANRTVGAGRYDPAMAKVQYESKDDEGHRFWTARYGRYAIRIDANRPGLYRWVITLEGRSIRKGTAPSRDEAADAVSQALEELPH
jgi:hypothetical protein